METIKFDTDLEIEPIEVLHDFKMIGNCDELFTAISRAQLKFKGVAENRNVNIGKYSYNYADLSSIIDMVRPALNENQIAMTQSVTKGRVQTILGGHGGALIYTTEFANTDIEPKSQGSLFSYYKRYSLSAALGFASGGEDMDAIETNPDGTDGKVVKINKKKVTSETLSPVNQVNFIAFVKEQVESKRDNKEVMEFYTKHQNEIHALKQKDEEQYKEIIQFINNRKKEFTNGKTI